MVLSVCHELVVQTMDVAALPMAQFNDVEIALEVTFVIPETMAVCYVDFTPDTFN